jgi:hypothetical protein
MVQACQAGWAGRGRDGAETGDRKGDRHGHEKYTGKKHCIQLARCEFVYSMICLWIVLNLLIWLTRHIWIFLVFQPTHIFLIARLSLHAKLNSAHVVEIFKRPPGPPLSKKLV